MLGSSSVTSGKLLNPQACCSAGEGAEDATLAKSPEQGWQWFSAEAQRAHALDSSVDFATTKSATDDRQKNSRGPSNKNVYGHNLNFVSLFHATNSLLLIFQPFKNLKTILSSWDTHKEMAGHSLPTSGS